MLSDDLAARARARSGLLPVTALGSHPARAAERAGLVLVQPGVAAAVTQPMDVTAQIESVLMSLRTPYAFLAETAIWGHGAGPAPALVQVGVASTRGLNLLPPVVGRRVAPGLMRGVVLRRGLPLVGLELAVVQASVGRGHDDVVRLLEDLVRQRRTTVDRLLAHCHRGLPGSAAVRAAATELLAGDLDVHQRRLRRALEAAGVTGLQSEVHLTSRTGATCYLDLLHVPTRRALEVDGAVTHGTAAQQRVDRRRDRWVWLDHGIATTRIAVSEVQGDLPDLVRDLVRLLDR